MVRLYRVSIKKEKKKNIRYLGSKFNLVQVKWKQSQAV